MKANEVTTWTFLGMRKQHLESKANRLRNEIADRKEELETTEKELEDLKAIYRTKTG